MALNASKAVQAARIQEKIDALEEKKAELMKHIRAEAQKGSNVVEHLGYQVVVKATPKQVFDTAAFQKDHPKEGFSHFYETKTVFVTGSVKADERKGYLTDGTTAISIEITKRPE